MLLKFIEVKNVDFSYEQDEEILNDFSLDIEKGSFVAVLGHNGSGKSTLAKLLNGLNLPDKGKVYIDGIDTADESKSLDIRKRLVCMNICTTNRIDSQADKSKELQSREYLRCNLNVLFLTSLLPCLTQEAEKTL